MKNFAKHVMFTWLFHNFVPKTLNQVIMRLAIIKTVLVENNVSHTDLAKKHEGEFVQERH